TDRGLAGWCLASSDLFDATTIERLLGHFRALLTAVADDPGRRLLELPLLSSVERQQLREWNATAAVYPEGRRALHLLLVEQAGRTPDAAALVFGSATLTYAEGDRRASCLAGRLCAEGVGPETRVGICAERSLDLLLGLLAILKAGGAYVPLDPSYPAERLPFLLEGAGVSVP